jgi:peptidoglycan/LPS O-acetylase OafA/YrhL
MGTPDKRPDTIAALAGARAIPPLLIVFYHYCEGHHYSGVGLLDRIATRGYLWVEFFFALSGFILTHVYRARLTELWTRKGYLGFLRARLTRLYPLHLFMLLALLALMVSVRAAAHAGGYASIYDRVYHPMMTPIGFVTSLFLVNGWNTLSYLAWNGVSWFVSVEFALCLIFPLFLWLADGRSWRGLALALAGLGGMLALQATSQHGLDITFHNGVLRGLSDFSVGVGMAVLFGAARNCAQALPVWLHSALQLLMVASLLFVFTQTGWSHTSRDILSVMPMLGLIFVLAFDVGIVADMLKTRLPQRLGEWSYAIYMGQTFWLQYMRVIESRFYPSPDAMVLGTHFLTLMWWLEPTLLILVCALWGGALAEWVEKPAGAFLKRRLDRPRAAAPSSGIT